MNMNTFLSQHAVFTVAQLDRFLSSRGSGKPNTRKSLLTYYRQQGRIIPIRRGLYATVPPGQDSASYPVDPYLVAALMTPDAVLAYHTALEFHGKAYTVYTQLHYLSAAKSVPLTFQAHQFMYAPVPKALKVKGETMFGITRRQRSGVALRVTNFERTLVDVLDRPELTGSWEEIWRSLDAIEFFDLDQVVRYVQLLANATTAAKVGFYLDRNREALMVGDAHLDRLRRMRPRQPHYLVRGKRQHCKWVKDWNLMIPIEILTKSWEDVL